VRETNRLSDRSVATWVGVLFIVGTACGALSIVVTKPILTAPDYLARMSQGRPQMVLGSLLGAFRGKCVFAWVSHGAVGRAGDRDGALADCQGV
jgi:hypothetical protein